MTERFREAESERGESASERYDRNTMELLNELRVANTGIQVMFAFLLVLPFNTGWKHVDPFERTVYFITLCIVAVAAFLLLAPAVHLRVLFHRGEKGFLVRSANVISIVGMVLLACGFVGILVLLSDVVVGGAAPWIAGGLAGVFVSGLWFVIPLARREED